MKAVLIAFNSHIFRRPLLIPGFFADFKINVMTLDQLVPATNGVPSEKAGTEVGDKHLRPRCGAHAHSDPAVSEFDEFVSEYILFLFYVKLCVKRDTGLFCFRKLSSFNTDRTMLTLFYRAFIENLALTNKNSLIQIVKWSMRATWRVPPQQQVQRTAVPVVSFMWSAAHKCLWTLQTQFT